MTKAPKSYLEAVSQGIQHIESQFSTIDKIAQLVYKSFEQEGVMHVFGSGHSNVLAFELFHRAGGLIPINPIFEPQLMPHFGPKRVGPTERLSGFAKVIFDNYEFREGEVVLIVSNSGINAVPVEFAKLCKDSGLVTIALTSLIHSKSVPSRADGKLYEVCDYVLDSGSPVGDACVSVGKGELKVAPISSVLSITIAEVLVSRVAEIFAENDKVPPVLQSANTPGGDEHNKILEDKYRARIQSL